MIGMPQLHLTAINGRKQTSCPHHCLSFKLKSKRISLDQKCRSPFRQHQLSVFTEVRSR